MPPISSFTHVDFGVFYLSSGMPASTQAPQATCQVRLIHDRAKKNKQAELETPRQREQILSTPLGTPTAHPQRKQRGGHSPALALLELQSQALYCLPPHTLDTPGKVSYEIVALPYRSLVPPSPVTQTNTTPHTLHEQQGKALLP